MVSLKRTSEGLHIYYLDVFSLLNMIANHPGLFGFTNTFTDLGPAANCLLPIDPGSQSCDALPNGFDADGSVFWDALHPTRRLHKYIAIAAAFCLKTSAQCELS